MLSISRRKHFLLACVGLIILAGCGETIQTEARFPSNDERAGRVNENDIYSDQETIFGDGLKLFGGRSDNARGETGIGVNSFLWRASLDTVSFMPLASVDPFGGVILTDWHSAADNPDERFKLNVFILSEQLRSNGIRVKAFRQVRRGGSWQDAEVSPDTSRQLEDAILTRARQLRVTQLEQ